MASIMISCGEPSGDLYAGALSSALKQLDPACSIFGLGGEALAAGGGELVGDYRGLAVTGLTEALAVLPRSFAMYRRLVRAARHRRPDVLVVIDFPDFNFRLAAAVRRLGVRVVYYVPPQIWAWRRGRLRTIRRMASQVLVIFPFEAGIYEKAGVPVQFVGHPLLDLARPARPRRAFLSGLGLEPGNPSIALLPGSRPNEVRALAPILAGAVPLIAQEVPSVQFVVAKAPNLDRTLFSSLESARPLPVIVEGSTDDVLSAADLVLTCSGTATVQAAIHGRPMIVMYRVSPLSYRLGKPFVHVDTYGMVNLVAGRPVVPELIQDGLDADALASEAVRLLTDGEQSSRMRVQLEDVKRRLGSEGASRRAAEAVFRLAAHVVQSR